MKTLTLCIYVFLSTMATYSYGYSCSFKPLADFEVLKTALHSHYLDCKKYPSTLSSLTLNVDGIECWRPYLERIPSDPWGNPYKYELGAFQWGFEISTSGKDLKWGTEDDISNQDADEGWRSVYGPSCEDAPFRKALTSFVAWLAGIILAVLLLAAYFVAVRKRA